jgi:hypothetical protein
MEGTTVSNDFDTFSNTVLSAEYTYGNLFVAAEYIQTEKEYTFIMTDMSDSEAKTADGWYIASAYQFTDWFALGGYYSASYNDKDDRDGDTATDMSPKNRYYFEDICITTSFMITPYWTIKLEGHQFRGTNGVSSVFQEADGNGNIFTEENWNLFAIKTTFSF